MTTKLILTSRNITPIIRFRSFSSKNNQNKDVKQETTQTKEIAEETHKNEIPLFNITTTDSTGNKVTNTVSVSEKQVQDTAKAIVLTAFPILGLFKK